MAVRRFVIKIDGQVYEVEAEEIGPAASEPSALSSPVAPVPAPVAKVPGPSVREGGEETVTAPLPGTVLEIKVGVGDEVQVGQVLVLLEAMKMENEIRAMRSGQVRALLVQKGQAVSAGDPLLQLA